MRLEYDPKYNIAYIQFLEGRAEDLQTLHVSEELNIDMAPHGHIYGIELLNISRKRLPVSSCGSDYHHPFPPLRSNCDMARGRS